MERKRRTSILKRTETPVTPTLTRRISFHGKKSVKEFSEGSDHATIWHNSYEEEAVAFALDPTPPLITNNTTVDINKENHCIIPSITLNGVVEIKSAMKSKTVESHSVNMDIVNDGNIDMDLTPLQSNKIEVMYNRPSLIPVRSPSRQSSLSIELSRLAQDQVTPGPQNRSKSRRLNHADLTFDSFIEPTSTDTRRLTTNIPTSMDIDQTASAIEQSSHIHTKFSKNRFSINAPTGMDLTMIDSKTSAEVAAQIERCVNEQSCAMQSKWLLKDLDADEEEFFQKVDNMSFDNFACESDDSSTTKTTTTTTTTKKCSIAHTKNKTIFGSELDVTNVIFRQQRIERLDNKCSDALSTSITFDDSRTNATHSAENMSITQRFECDRDFISSTKIGLDNMTDIDGSDMNLSAVPETAVPNECRKSVIECTDYMRQLCDEEQRLFDRTVNHLDVDAIRSPAKCIDDVSDSVLVGQHMDASSSMRLFHCTQTPSKDTLSTTEELCNFDTDELCKQFAAEVERKHQRDDVAAGVRMQSEPVTLKTVSETESWSKKNASVRLSGLREHVNLTITTADDYKLSDDDDDDDVDDVSLIRTSPPNPQNAAQPSVAEPPQMPRKSHVRCSIGTADENPADLCKRCAGCRRRVSLGSLSHLLEQNPDELIDEAIGAGELKLDYSVYDRLIGYMGIEQVLRKFGQSDDTKRADASRGISLNVPEPSIVFLLKNKLDEEFAGQQRVRESEKIADCPAPIFPINVSSKLLLQNKFDNETLPWEYCDLYFCRGRLRFINKRIRTVIVYASFDYSLYKSDIAQPIKFESVCLQECNIQTGDHIAPLNQVRHHELLANVPRHLLGLCPNSDKLMTFLDHMDRTHFRPVHERVALLYHEVCSNGALLCRQPDGRCFVRKTIFDRTHLHAQKMVISIACVELTTTQHVFTEPVIGFRPNATKELGSGIQFVKRILSDPYRYLIPVYE